MPNYQIVHRTADLLALSDVHRWTVIKTLRSQSVAEHSFNVAVIAMEIADRLGIHGLPALEIHRWALVHDAPETYTGDIDGKFKRENPDIRASVSVAEKVHMPWYSEEYDGVAPRTALVVKMADYIEAIIHITQWGHGSRARDVSSELRGILCEEFIPKMAITLGMTEHTLLTMAIEMVDGGVSEKHGFQMRREHNYR